MASNTLLQLLEAVEKQKRSSISPGETLAEAELWSLAIEIRQELREPTQGARGEKQVRQFGGAMLHQLQLNKGKGDWHDPKQTTDQSVWQLFYHVMKLVLALCQEDIDPVRIQEYSADVGNEAMIAADVLNCLDSVYQVEEHTTVENQYDQVRSLMYDLTEVLVKHKVLPEGFDHDLLASEELVRDTKEK